MQAELDDTPPKKNHFFKKICNVLLMLVISWIAFALTVLLLSRETLVEFSKEFFSPETPLIVGSALLNFLLHPAFIVIPAIIIVGMVVKEIKIKSLQKRIYLNIGLLIAVSVHCGLIGYLLFQPVFKAT